MPGHALSPLVPAEIGIVPGRRRPAHVVRGCLDVVGIAAGTIAVAVTPAVAVGIAARAVERLLGAVRLLAEVALQPAFRLRRVVGAVLLRARNLLELVVEGDLHAGLGGDA